MALPVYSKTQGFRQNLQGRLLRSVEATFAYWADTCNGLSDCTEVEMVSDTVFYFGDLGLSSFSSSFTLFAVPDQY